MRKPGRQGNRWEWLAADSAAVTEEIRRGRRIQHARARVLPRLFHSVKGFLENFEITGVAGLFTRVLNPFLLQ